MTRYGFAIAFVLLLCFFSTSARAQNAENEKKSREHLEQAEMYMKAKVYDLAVEEYRKGYELVPQAHGFLFNIGLAYEQMGEKEKAIAAFEQYIELMPRGSKSAEARARTVALKRALEMERQAPPPATDPDSTSSNPVDTRVPQNGSGSGAGTGQSPGNTGTSPDLGTTSPGIVDGPQKSGRSWARIGLGTALIVAGLIADQAPESSGNGELDALDFLPVGLYGLGTMFVLQGTF